jgi:AsmA protein
MSRLFIVIAAIVGIIVAAFIGILVLLDNPDAYKQRLSSAFQSQTGYGLEIKGSLDWQYFPPIAIALSDITITTPKSEAPLASLKSASVDLKVMPLIFGGSVEISGLNVDGLTVNAAVDANGVGNWEIEGDSAESEISETTESATEASSSESGSSDSGTSESSLSIDIGGINITDAVINYTDQSTNSDYLLNLSQFRTGPVGTGVKTDIQGDIKLEDRISKLTADIALAGKASINESLDEFALENFTITSTVRQPESSAITTTVTLNGSVNTSTEIAKLNDSELKLADLTLAFNIEAKEIFGDTTIKGGITAPTFSARNVLVAVDADPGPTANPDALSKVSLNADIKGDLNAIALSKLNLTLDQSQLTGTATINMGAKTGVTFDLTVDSIIASDYLAPTIESDQAASSSESTSIEDSEVLPVSTLRETDVNGNFRIATLNYETWVAKDLNIKINNQNQQLNIDGGAKAYEGDITFKLASNYAGETPNTTTAFGVNGVSVVKALELESMTGTLALNANHTFQGSMMSQLVTSLNGQSTFNVADGTLDVRPLKKIAAIIDGLQTTKSGIAEWPDMLPFKFLQGDHSFNKGITSGQTIDASIENLTLAGTGGIDYFANTMVYDFDAVLLDTAGQFSVNRKLIGVRFPLHCEGALDAEPAELCAPDRAAITKVMKDLAAAEIKRKGSDAIKKTIEENVPDELKDAAKGLLKGFFN